MDWHYVWRKGSFRGAEFCWKHNDVLVGRKTARHDYPQRDEAYIEDMGKTPREFTLECFVIGKNYTDQRDNLIKALETKGVGTLIHPTMGMMQVALNGGVHMTESNDEGGMCHFSIPFILSPNNMFFPSLSLGTAEKVNAQADISAGAMTANFSASFSVAGQPQFVADDAHVQFGGFCGGMTTLTASFSANEKTPAAMLAIANVQKSPALLNDPATLSANVAGIFSGLRTVALAPLDLVNDTDTDTPIDGVASRYNKTLNLPATLFDSYATLFDYGKSTSPISTMSSLSVPLTTPARITQAANRDAHNALVRGLAIVEAARTASTIDFISYDDAFAVLSSLLSAIDTEVLTASDDVYAVLMDLRAAVVTDINTRGADMSRIIKYTLPRTDPALVIAQRLYGDATRAEEIIARNNIRHPLFVPGGVALEVLSD